MGLSSGGGQPVGEPLPASADALTSTARSGEDQELEELRHPVRGERRTDSHSGGPQGSGSARQEDRRAAVRWRGLPQGVQGGRQNADQVSDKDTSFY